MNLLTEEIKIGSAHDIDSALRTAIRSEKEYFIVVAGEMEPILFRLRGGRFDGEFVPIDTLKIARVYRTSFKRFFKIAAGKEPSDEMIYFNAKRGSFELDFQNILEVFITQAVGKMSGFEFTVVIILLIGAWVSKSAYSAYLASKKDLAEIEARKASDDESKARAELMIRIIDDLLENNILKNAKNRPPRTALEILDGKESLVYGNAADPGEYSQEDLDEFFCESEPKIKHETIEEPFYVKAVKDAGDHIEVVLRNGKLKTFSAISKLDDNMPLYTALDKQQEIALKVNIGRDESGDIVEADIYEVCQEKIGTS